jgi:hypothetical protein
MRFLPSFFCLLLSAMAASEPTADASSPVTRIATFRFRPSVTAEQKGDRASAFLTLYAEHPELLLEGPKGGRPLNTPLNLTNVKRESVWDTGFVVVFKVYLSSRLDVGGDIRGECQYRRRSRMLLMLANAQQDEAARQAFDLDPGHDRLKVSPVWR